MTSARKLKKCQQQPRTLLGHVRQFLTPRAWKQARQAVPKRRAKPRWDLQPLVLVAIAMTWAAGDSELERFETARGFYIACYAARRRPGKTWEGFQKALGRVPMRQLRTLAAIVRLSIRAYYGDRLLSEDFEPMGCDGSRLECPRTGELEARLGPAGKDQAAPSLWLTAFVHLGTGLLWSWQLGPGNAAEQVHLRRLLETLSLQALIICDAAYMGYDLACAILGSRRSFLIRMSSRTHLYTLEKTTLEEWTDGLVLYWPKYVQEKGEPPLPCRLIRVKATGQAKHDVWLLTNVLDPARLSAQTAAKFYRWRWRNEGLFRIYKRTINKVKLSSRTVRLVHREAELSLLATQLLLAHADLALRPQTKPASGDVVVSPRQVLIEVRREMKGTTKQRTACYGQRLTRCNASDRKQTSPKATREWPRRKPHQPPKPPILHTLNERQKTTYNQHFRPAA